jgi:ribonuclease HI/ADP-ribose pyrophosphatase YjhB (NUDIX family)
MKQRVVVQAIINDGERVLLLRRSQGRPGIVGKYELPGGAIDDSEQPDDGLKRHIRNEIGVTEFSLELIDAVSLKNREEGDIQHILIVYRVSGISNETPITLGQSYDSHMWTEMSKIQQNTLRDSAYTLLGLYLVPVTESETPAVSKVFHHNLGRTVMYSDGGSRGNPGPSAAAFVILDDQGQVVDRGGAYLGITTNNQAEYHGVRLGLERALESGILDVEFRVDSMLVVNQLRGLYKIKNRELWPIYERIEALLPQFTRIKFTHVPRELNQTADALVNKILDEHLSQPG